MPYPHRMLLGRTHLGLGSAKIQSVLFLEFFFLCQYFIHMRLRIVAAVLTGHVEMGMEHMERKVTNAICVLLLDEHFDLTIM